MITRQPSPCLDRRRTSQGAAKADARRPRRHQATVTVGSGGEAGVFQYLSFSFSGDQNGSMNGIQYVRICRGLLPESRHISSPVFGCLVAQVTEESATSLPMIWVRSSRAVVHREVLWRSSDCLPYGGLPAWFAKHTGTLTPGTCDS